MKFMFSIGLTIILILIMMAAKACQPEPVDEKPKEKTCSNKPIVIAVIDTGYGDKNHFIMKQDAKLCKFGHKDFTGGGLTYEFGTKAGVPEDNHGHGTHVVGIIDEIAKKAKINYCIVILKYFETGTILDTQLTTDKAIEFADNIGADFINYSGGGVEFSKYEQKVVKNYIDHGGKFIAAAGNEKSNLKYQKYFPAMVDDRVIVVGNGKNSNDHAPLSNYGDRVNFWENGDNIVSYGMYMSGTSQAAAIRTGKMIAATKNYCK